MKMIDYDIYELSKKESTQYLVLASILIATILYLFYNTLLVIFPSVICAGFTERLYATYKAAGRRDILITQFRDFLYSLSASADAGRHMEESFKDARTDLLLLYDEESPMIKELDSMITRNEAANESVEQMLLDLGKRSGIRDITTFAEVCRICGSTGGDIVKVIGITSQMLLDKLTIVRDIESYTAQKKFEGKVIAILPPTVILFLNLTAPVYLAPMYNCFAGRIIMTAALFLMIFGYAAAQKITDIGIWSNENDKRIFTKKNVKKTETS